MQSIPSRGRVRRLRAPRRVKLVATALVIISLSAAGLFVVSLFPNALAALSGIVTDYPGYIRATNAIAAASCAFFFLWPRAGSRLVGRWNEYVGWAFFILSIQYMVRLAALLVTAFVLPKWEGTIKVATDFVIYPASFLNNILFLMAARILLNKSKGLRDVRTPMGRGVLAYVKYYLRGLRAGLPKRVWLMFPLTLLAMFEPYTVWARFPDAIFSIFCLSWFGYAVGLSLQVRRRRAMAWASFVLVLSYGAGQLVFALNPVIADTLLDQSPSPSARWLKATLWPDIDKVIFQDFKRSDFGEPDKLLNRLVNPQEGDAVALYLHDHPLKHPFNMLVQNKAWSSSFRLEEKQEALTGELNAQLSKPLYKEVRLDNINLRPETRVLLKEAQARTEIEPRLNRLLLEDAFHPLIKKMATARDFLDGAIFAILFPMKYLLFMPAFVLYLLSLVSVNSFRRALHKTTNIRKDYLSEDGILDVIGKSMDADEVKLFIRIPGVMRRQGTREERCLVVPWSATKKYAGKREREPFPIAKSRLLSRVMAQGSEIVLTNKDEGQEADELRARGASPQTLVLIPIKFHGGVIGAVWANFSGYGKFNDGTLEQLKFMAELVAPSVQDFRTMSAVDKFGVRLNRGKFEAPGKSQDSARTPASTGDFNAAMDELMAMLFDLLTPLCVSLLIECGFKTSRPAYPCAGPYHKILQEHGAVYGPKRTGSFDTESGTVIVFEDYLPSSTGKSEQLGKLILIIPRDKDEFNRPTLAAHYLTRLMIASLVANGIINAARASLAVVIHDLGPKLNKETLSYEQWFTEIDEAARKAGLLWVVATGISGSHSLHGRLEYVEIVKGLTVEEKEALQREPLDCIAHKVPASTTRHIIHLKLNDEGGGLWLGVGREGFGFELKFNSPWKEFLEQLAGVAKAALKSIDDRLRNEAERQREEKVRLQAAKEETEKAIAREWIEKNNLLRLLAFHDLIHMVRVTLDVASAASEAANNGIEGSADRIMKSVNTILDSTKRTQGLIRVINDLTRWDGPRSCSIVDAVEQAKQLIQHPLTLKRINLQHHIRPEAKAEAVADLPLNVGTLVIANLLRNAAEASEQDGTITIHTKVTSDTVLCSMLNNGKPVPDDLREKLSKLPLTPTDSHNGWGLFVIPRLLQKFNGTLQLVYSNDSETCFILRLPIAKG